MEIMKQIPVDLVNFLLVTLFSLAIGMEQRRHHIKKNVEYLFGTDRTLTLIGILGFVLYTISKETMVPFLIGASGLLFLLGIAYYNKIKIQGKFGLTSTIIALITYSLAPLVYLEPSWLVMLVIVTLLMIVEMKKDLSNIAVNFGRDEFTILAKFIIIAGVVLPLLPHTPISESINVSPYQFWLAIVAISGISYFSYILKKFIFPESGILLTAILGGMYSSTATTIILAKKSKAENHSANTVSGILGATGIMYIRILILAWIFNTAVATKLIIPFMILVITSFMSGVVFLNRAELSGESYVAETDKNPLEFRTALIFGLLFSFFAIITNFVLTEYGKAGIDMLSLIVGVTDIDPYILNLFQNTSAKLSVGTIASATILATASNNIIKLVYTLLIGNVTIRKNITIGFSAIIVASFVLAFIF